MDALPPGSIGWVPENGGLISNLKTWENVTLPLWYHGKRRVAETEEKTARWLAALGVEEQAMAAFMASPPGRLSTLERKRAGLLRGLLLAPRALVQREIAQLKMDLLGTRESMQSIIEEKAGRTPSFVEAQKAG